MDFVSQLRGEHLMPAERLRHLANGCSEWVAPAMRAGAEEIDRLSALLAMAKQGLRDVCEATHGTASGIASATLAAITSDVIAPSGIQPRLTTQEPDTSTEGAAKP